MLIAATAESKPTSAISPIGVSVGTAAAPKVKSAQSDGS